MKQEYFEFLSHIVKHGQGDSDKHVLTLYSIALQISAVNILELGVRSGQTTLPFLCAAIENGGTVHSVDINPTNFVCPSDLSNHWKFYQSDAIEWLKTVSGNTNNNNRFDLVYIDDWHSYDHVKLELELIDNIVTPSSVILLHDLMYGNAQPHYRSDTDTIDPEWKNGGPYRAVAELDQTVWEWATIPVNHGLTILRKKSGRVIA